VEPPLEILHVEDDPVDGLLVVQLLKQAGFEVQIERLHTFKAFQRFLEQRSPALILADYTVPGFDVLKGLQWARQVRPEIPFIFLSGTLGEDVAIETLKMGATDYVLKQRIGRLVPAVRRALQEAEVQLRRKSAEETLHRTYSLFRAVVEGVTDAIFVKDDGGHYLMINTAGARKLGQTSSAEVLSKDDRSFFPPDALPAIRARDCAVMVSGAPQCYEETCQVEGRLRVFLTSEAPYRDHRGTTIGVLGISHDITERKMAEQEIQQSNETLEDRVRQRTRELDEANASLRTFAHMAAHDFRAPVRAITGCAELLLSEGPADSDAMTRSMLERIRRSAQQVNRLLDGILEFCQLGQSELKLEPVDLRRAVSDAVALIDEDIQARHAALEVQENLPAVLGHPATVVLLLSNYISNALKFVPPGRRPRVSVGAEVYPEVADSQVSGRFVRFFVQDNGIGIAPKDHKRIFGAFERVHSHDAYPGAGLGLAIVKRAVERMGGKVGVESEPDKGSRFWIALPRVWNVAAHRRSGLGPG
jgi:PAS domain S-box-containing protein